LEVGVSRQYAALRDLPKATIAQVQGYCIFGGYMFASAMDLIVAADDAMFLPSLTQYFSAPGRRRAQVEGGAFSEPFY
jgi:enoyl-CoA hydratase/carnithine racemase